MRRAWLLACAGLLVVGTARGEERPAAAGAGPAPLAAPGEKPSHDDGRRTLRRLPANLALGAVGFFHGDNVVPLLVGGMATASASFLDERVAEDIADPGHAFGKSLEDGAAPEWIGVAVAGAFTAGRFSSHPRFRAMSYDLLDAFVLNGAFTTALKLSVGRERPNGEDDKSFPSGHTSNAFAVAAVAERHYGWKVGVPAYTVAALVGVSRLQRNKHYLSDVVAGAALGYVVGRTVVRVNGRPVDAARRAQLSLGPVVGRRTRGFIVTVTF